MGKETAAEATAEKTGEAPQLKRRKKRRRAVAISRVDEELIRDGMAPSWNAVRPLQPRKATESQRTDYESARDRELRENVPPHW
ncbi:MAG: hypothetical protein Q4P05_07040 [Actinomycetaceae bacterium]|nr:hypothetical protein [Actinomycetaceae bacterium]